MKFVNELIFDELIYGTWKNEHVIYSPQKVTHARSGLPGVCKIVMTNSMKFNTKRVKETHQSSSAV